MYKVLLVDDERITLENMKKVIQWENFGFAVAGIAENGKQACAFLEKEEVHLVITDVMMPEMNGIELAEYISRNYPKTEMVIISGYDEFDYARSAMRAGVMEYITKPTEKAEIEKALINAVRRIRRREEAEQNMRELKAEAEKNIPVLKNQFFNDLANQIFPECRPITQTLKHYHSALEGKPYYLWCFDLDRTEEYEKNPQVRELFWVQLNMLAREVIAEKVCFDTFVKGNLLFYIVEGKEELPAREFQEELLEQILSEFQNLTRSSLSVSISRRYEEYEKLYSARRDCETALEERCNMGEGSCIFFEDIQTLQNGAWEHNYEVINQICSKIRAQNRVQAEMLIENMYRRMQKNKAIYPQFYSQTVLILTELFNVAAKEETRERIRKEMVALYDCKTVEKLKKPVLEIMEEIIENVSKDSAGKNEKLMAQIVEYVDQHISEEITLTNAADAVHMSKSYLCSIFKKEKGETFFSYLTKRRMEKAKQLLRKTDHKVYVVAEMVGYTDYPYFSQVFKKYVGVTAGEYREIYGGE